MSEETGVTSTTEETDSQAKEFEPITSQEEFDKRISGRIARERAKYADYDQLVAAKAELDQIRDSHKTEAQKAQERILAAEKRAADLELKAARAVVAASKGVPPELLSGSTQEELEASAEALIKFRGDTTRYVARSEGNSPQGKQSAEVDFARALFGGKD